MKLFLYEMKKIFSWKLILLVILLNVLMFKLMIEFDLNHFPNGRPDGDMFKIEQQLIPKYGPKIDEHEFSEIKEIYERKVKQADHYLANDKDAIAAGLENYEKFSNYDENNELQRNYHDELFFNRNLDFPWELQSYKWYLEEYQYAKEAMLIKMEDATTTAQKKHFEQLLKENKLPFYSDRVTYNFKTYKTSVAITIFLSIIILLSPIYLRDVQANVVSLQYSSRKGRKTFRVKWLAGLVSTIFMTSFLLTFYMMLYQSNDTSSHFDLPLHTLGRYDSWYDLTFSQYIMLSIIVIFIMSLLLGILTMAISSVVKNTLALIATQIVVAFVMIAGGASFIVRNVIDLQFPQFFVPGLLIIFIGFIVIVTYIVWKKERAKDIF